MVNQRFTCVAKPKALQQFAFPEPLFNLQRAKLSESSNKLCLFAANSGMRSFKNLYKSSSQLFDANLNINTGPDTEVSEPVKESPVFSFWKYKDFFFSKEKGFVMAVKKQWYDVYSPKEFGEKVVGETPASDPKLLVGRTIEVSFMEISRDFSRFYIKMLFQITDVDGTKARTKFVGHDTMYERVYRLVQRHMRRVDVVQDVETKDGTKIRVKTIFALVRRVNTSIKEDARHLVRDIIEQTAKESNSEDFISMILKGDLQKDIRRDCSKIYPTGNIEIRKTEIQQQKKAKAAA